MSTIAALTLFAAGCGSSNDGCDSAGCEDPIKLTFEDPDGEPIDGFEGEITVGDETITFSCGDGGAGEKYRCGEPGVLSLDIDEVGSLEVDVRDADDASTLAYVGSVGLSYSEYFPNGEGCPPTCRQADETVTMTPTQAD